jgi:hypothetical protein
MEEVTKIILNWLIPVVLTGIFVFLQKNAKDNKIMKMSMLSLIRSQIVSKCEGYNKKGFLPEYARYCLSDLFEQYKALGGNHGIEVLVNNTFELPSNKEEE